MDWTPIAPYLVATLAFLRWPTLWIVIVVVSAFSVYRGRAALTSGVATIIGLALLLDAEIAGPHLELANYGHVIFAAAVTATLLMLPTILWTPLDAGPKAIGHRARFGAACCACCGFLCCSAQSSRLT